MEKKILENFNNFTLDEIKIRYWRRKIKTFLNISDWFLLGVICIIILWICL